MNKRRILIALGLTTMGALAGFGVKALADGIPSPNPLYYSGTLTEGGAMVTGTRAITVNLWSDGTTSGSPLCTTVASTADVVSGRFRIALASACKAIVNQNANVYVEVIDGATSLGRSPIGAVPYAVEADHAVTATNASNATTANTAGGALATSISQLQAEVHPASGFHAWLTNTVSVASNTATAVAFDHVEFDLTGEYTSTTGVFKPQQAGQYIVVCTSEYGTASVGSLYAAIVLKNGTRVAEADVHASLTNSITAEITTLVQLAAGDSVTCSTYQTAGTVSLSTLAGLTAFSAARLH